WQRPGCLCQGGRRSSTLRSSQCGAAGSPAGARPARQAAAGLATAAAARLLTAPPARAGVWAQAVLDDVVELGEGLRHRQPDAREELRIDHLRDRVEHHLGEELRMHAAEMAGSRAAFDQSLQARDALALMAHESAVGSRRAREVSHEL